MAFGAYCNMQYIPSLTYMDGDPISEIANRIERELEGLLDAQSQVEGTSEQGAYDESVELHKSVCNAMRIIIEHLNSEHDAYVESREPDRSWREDFHSDGFA